ALAPLTVSGTQRLASDERSMIVVGASVAVDGSGRATPGADLFTWFGDDSNDFWIRASLADVGGEPSRTITAVLSRTLHPRVGTFGDLTYGRGNSESWLRLSHGVVYHWDGGRSVEMTCRQQLAGRAECGLTFTVPVGQ